MSFDNGQLTTEYAVKPENVLWKIINYARALCAPSTPNTMQIKPAIL